MDYLLLFLVNGVLGYGLQSLGNLLAILAINKKKIPFKQFILCLLLFSLLMFGIRSITAFSFGFHTILIMLAFIVLSVLILKVSVPQTVLAVLLTSVVIILAEIINFGALRLFFGSDTVDVYLKGDGTLQGNIMKAVIGIPTNVILITVMAIFYRIRMKKADKKEIQDGEAGAQNS